MAGAYGRQGLRGDDDRQRPVRRVVGGLRGAPGGGSGRRRVRLGRAELRCGREAAVAVRALTAETPWRDRLAPSPPRVFPLSRGSKRRLPGRQKPKTAFLS